MSVTENLAQLSDAHRKLFGQWWGCDDGDGFHFKALEYRTGLPRAQIRSLVRDLAKAGCLEFKRGCWTDEGEPYGSAYVLTVEGYHAVHSLPSGEQP